MPAGGCASADRSVFLAGARDAEVPAGKSVF
jgi:hypothetical protein